MVTCFIQLHFSITWQCNKNSCFGDKNIPGKKPGGGVAGIGSATIFSVKSKSGLCCFIVAIKLKIRINCKNQ